MKEESPFKTPLAEEIFKNKYAFSQAETWHQRAITIVDSVCGTMGGERERPLLDKSSRDELVQMIKTMKFLPGGRYIYYAGRPARFYNNCYLLRAEDDTREEWANVVHRALSCLMTGGGIGIDYSVLRASDRILSRTGGRASGPLPLMEIVNEVGRHVMQGGSRRSAIYASLNWRHDDAPLFLRAKNWFDQNIYVCNDDPKLRLTHFLAKEQNFNHRAPLDMTNISLNYDDTFLEELDNEDGTIPATFLENCRQALSTGEPGFSFNFGDRENETLRNACTEVCSEDDSDVCNLGSLNLAAFDTLDEFQAAVGLASKFLVCGTVRADLPYDKVYKIREKNRRLGLGLMGIHEWLLKRGYKYECDEELQTWLTVYRDESEQAANDHCNRLYLSKPVAYRAIAPTGSIGILAGTTTGIEPIFACAYKRRYLVNGTTWKFQFVVDPIANRLIKDYEIKPEDIETSYSLSKDFKRRIQMQADIQDYVDMSISSTINLPEWNTDANNEAGVPKFAKVLSSFAPRLRGFTCYPQGARGGQPLVEVPYEDAIARKGVVYEEQDICELTKGGICGA